MKGVGERGGRGRARERERERESRRNSIHYNFHFIAILQVAQVAAKTLGIPLEMIKVKPSMTLTNPNGLTTGGSITSEMNCFVSHLLTVKLIYCIGLL